MKLLAMIGKALRWVLGLIAPMFVRVALSPGVLWTVHIIIIALMAVGLYFVQKHYGLMQSLKGPPWFRPYWLPVLFLLVYFLAWQAWWLWKLLQPGDSVSVFPDIDHAWTGIQNALDKAGIGMADTPVFLVLGESLAGEASLFKGLPKGVAINGAPSSSDPIRVYASREAIYLTCPGASLLGIQAGGDVPSELPSMSDPNASVAMEQSIGMERSIGMEKSIGMSEGGGGNDSIRQVQAIIRQAQDERRPLTEAEKEKVRKLSSQSFAGGRPPAKRGGGSVLQDVREVERTTARTNYFCSLIAKARWPLCPINGAIIQVSIAAGEKDDIAQQTGLVAQKDLANYVHALRLRFPVYALISDLDTLPGAAEFIQRFPRDLLKKRMGKSFPLNPDVKPASAPDLIESGAKWVFQNLLSYWVFKLFRLETPNVESPNQASTANGNLFKFLNGVRERGERVAGLVARAVVPSANETPSFGGCYVTGLDASNSEPLFAHEFFQKVESSQGFVEWTDEAFANDASYRSKAKLGYTVLVLITLAVVALAVFVWGGFHLK